MAVQVLRVLVVLQVLLEYTLALFISGKREVENNDLRWF
jgi:hypothetical protein